jgi:hypothetical protein
MRLLEQYRAFTEPARVKRVTDYRNIADTGHKVRDNNKCFYQFTPMFIHCFPFTTSEIIKTRGKYKNICMMHTVRL